MKENTFKHAWCEIKTRFCQLLFLSKKFSYWNRGSNKFIFVVVSIKSTNSRIWNHCHYHLNFIASNICYNNLEVLHDLPRALIICGFELTLSWRRSLSCRNQFIDLLCNQWTSFYMIRTTVMKKLSRNS